MKINFTKMHGCGNDYIYVDCRGGVPFDPVAAAVRLSERHFGVGADGLVLIEAAEDADAGMRMFNADGSEGGMCGNALRCVAKFLYERAGLEKTAMRIQTADGIKRVTLEAQGGIAGYITVHMGPARFAPEEVPVLLPAPGVDTLVEVGGYREKITALSMGNPHCVIFCEDPRRVDLHRIGPVFECAEIFPQRANIEFVSVTSPCELRMRVWERGSGETLACGTGACAAAAAAICTGRVQAEGEIAVSLPGGTLYITSAPDGIYMRGPAEFVFDGAVQV